MTVQSSHLLTADLDRLGRLTIRLKDQLLQQLDEWKVEPVEPEDRFVWAAGVVVPGKLGRQNEISLIHHTLLTVNWGVGAVSLDYKAEGGCSVTVRTGIFSRLHVLEGHMNGVTSGVTVLEPRVDKTNCSSLGVFKTDNLTGSHKAFV